MCQLAEFDMLRRIWLAKTFSLIFSSAFFTFFFIIHGNLIKHSFMYDYIHILIVYICWKFERKKLDVLVRKLPKTVEYALSFLTKFYRHDYFPYSNRIRSAACSITSIVTVVAFRIAYCHLLLIIVLFHLNLLRSDLRWQAELISANVSWFYKIRVFIR